MDARRQLALLWGGVAVALVALSPLASQLAAAAPACPVKELSGWPCPGCGATRAALALARLDPLAAVGWSPLAAAGWAGLVVGGLAAGVAAALRKPLPGLPTRLPLWGRLAIVAAAVANWLYLVVHDI